MGNPSVGVFRVGLEIPKTLWLLSLYEFNLGNNFIVIHFSNIYGKQQQNIYWNSLYASLSKIAYQSSEIVFTGIIYLARTQNLPKNQHF